MKAVRAPGKNSGGHDGGGKVVHAYHKRSSPIEVGKKVIQPKYAAGKDSLNLTGAGPEK